MLLLVSDISIMFRTRILKNCVHLKESVITVHAFGDVNVIVCYVRLIVSHLKCNVIVFYIWFIASHLKCDVIVYCV